MEDGLGAIDGVIEYIHRHLYEPLPLARLAAYAAYSPYHFTRLFKRRVGVSPLYYVSSVRLQKAKELLLHTDLSVRDIGMQVGQQSVGTFTTRFTEKVGVAPGRFRGLAGEAKAPLRLLQGLTHWKPEVLMHRRTPGVVEGRVNVAKPFDGVILVGLFPKPVPEGVPIHGTVLPSPGPFSLSGVKPGVYYLLATSVTWAMEASDVLIPRRTYRARHAEPVIVEPGRPAPPLQLTLHEPRRGDPPILISLPLLMNRFLRRMHQKSNL